MREERAGSVGRLTKRHDFVAAATGRRFHTERMTVQGRLRAQTDPVPAEPGLRFGLTVTKRVGDATERNRIKRRLRTVCRLVGPDHAAVPVDVVIIGRRDILTAPYETLLDDLRRALRVVTKPKPAGTSGRPPAGTPSPSPDGERRGSTHA
ncbi:ribonuclease P protein component [Microvirga pudoricolor]|uniref:ribonuclease P protein component n=1 Tax=Microvirga pudoricolor TaxID=2778729 RepID=UPI0019528FBC|nr:ribonuclease P protein component [Microvirga pudoricolor]MBM6596228.1 ribonuclease P protein component [Microvirga pudoricolor]